MIFELFHFLAFQIDYTRYDPCEVKLEGLEDYGLVGGTKKFPNSSTPVPNNGQPKMMTKDGVRFQWNPYRRQYMGYVSGTCFTFPSLSAAGEQPSVPNFEKGGRGRKRKKMSIGGS